MAYENNILKILIPAVGGQGGGVLTEWLVTAFLNTNFEVQSISLPGLSQRGGSTVYYIEAYKTNSHNDNKPMIFSQYPIPGDVDIILCQEFLELGRVLQQGYGSDKTTIISSTHRIYSTLEKLPVSSGIYSDENLQSIATEFSSKFIGLNALDIAKTNKMDDLSINAILFGALCASNSIPLTADDLKKSIDQVGIAVKNNLKAFDIGYDYVAKNSIINDEEIFEFPDFIDEKENSTNRKYREDFTKIAASIKNYFPENLKIYLIEAVYRLIDYQNPKYAQNYLDNVNKIVQIDNSPNLEISENFIKNLALLLSYEDGIRVAELKIKSLRFSKIKDEMQIKDNQIFKVIDYLKPDAYEIYGLLPNIVITPILKIIDNTPLKKLKRKHKDITFAQKPETTSFLGFLRLFLLTKIKFLRPYSHRFVNEHKVINIYIDSTLKYTGDNNDLGALVAKSGSLIKGYGDVRRTTVDVFTRYIDNIIWPISKNLTKDQQLLSFAEKCLQSIRTDSQEIIKYEKELKEIILQKGVIDGS
jgi:indolepyruvate ferredoxin oxidoreductase beta subunit